MPCDAVRTYSVDFVAKDQQLLEKAVKALGFKIVNGVIYTNMGEITLDGNKAVCEAGAIPIVNKLRIQYGKEVFRQASKKHAWQMVSVNANEFVLSKGS